MERTIETIGKPEWPADKARLTVAKDRISFKHSLQTTATEVDRQKRFALRVAELVESPWTVRGEIKYCSTGLTVTLMSKRGKGYELCGIFAE